MSFFHQLQTNITRPKALLKEQFPFLQNVDWLKFNKTAVTITILINRCVGVT